MIRRLAHLSAVLGILLIAMVPAQAQEQAQDRNSDGTFDQDTILNEAAGFFGDASEALAKVIEKLFSDNGRPNGYISGQVIGGALVVGLRYGDGELTHKVFGKTRVYWRGPSIGLDVGAEGSKIFMLVYHLPDLERIYQTFPAVEGSAYFIGGIGVNYQQRDDIILAPIRTGVGLRFGANLGYVKFSKTRKWLPF